MALSADGSRIALLAHGGDVFIQEVRRGGGPKRLERLDGSHVILSPRGDFVVEVQTYSYATFNDSHFTQVENGSFATFPLNSFIYESQESDPIFTGVTILAKTIAGFTASDLSFNSHEVAPNFSGLRAIGTVAIGFTTASVPEPSSIITVLFGLVTIGGFGLFRRIRATA